MASIESGKMMKKGPWSWEEDQKLVAYIHRYGIWNWNHMADPAGDRLDMAVFQCATLNSFLQVTYIYICP